MFYLLMALILFCLISFWAVHSTKERQRNFIVKRNGRRNRSDDGRGRGGRREEGKSFSVDAILAAYFQPQGCHSQSNLQIPGIIALPTAQSCFLILFLRFYFFTFFVFERGRSVLCVIFVEVVHLLSNYLVSFFFSFRCLCL